MSSASAIEYRWLWLALGWTLVLSVIVLSVIPAPIQVSVVEGDKLGHLLAYGTLMVWFANLYDELNPRVILAIGLVAMGVILEFVQRWTGYRTFEIADMAADAIGVFAGWAVSPPRMPNFLRGVETFPVFRRKN